MKKKFKIIFIVLAVIAASAGGFGYWYWNSDAPEGTKYGDLASDSTGPVDAGKAQEREAANSAYPAPPFMSVVPSKEMTDGFPKFVEGKLADETFRAEYTGKLKRVRKVLMVELELYEIGCYIENPKPEETKKMLDELLTDNQRKVYIIKFSKSLPGRSILQAIKNEIDETFKDVDMRKVGKDIDRFVMQFSHGSKKHDCIYVAWNPGGRLYSSYNAADKMELICVDVGLSRAIWRIWCGPAAGEERVDMVKNFALPPLPNSKP